VPLGAMLEQWEPTSKDRALAQWAGACLGASVLILIALILVAWFAATPASTISTHPVVVTAALVAAGAYIVSVFALARLTRRRTTVEPRRLWSPSLLCNFTIVAIVVMGTGVVGLALCIMELAAIVLHIIAITKPGVRPHGA